MKNSLKEKIALRTNIITKKFLMENFLNFSEIFKITNKRIIWSNKLSLIPKNLYTNNEMDERPRMKTNEFKITEILNVFLTSFFKKPTSILIIEYRMKN